LPSATYIDSVTIARAIAVWATDSSMVMGRGSSSQTYLKFSDQPA
jgi:hypothetical protein